MSEQACTESSHAEPTNPSRPSLNDSAVMVFSRSLVAQLNKARLPPNYVGVRNIRPERDAGGMGKGEAPRVTSSVQFTVTNPDGTSRRMNRQEKKALKLKLSAKKKDTKRGNSDTNDTLQEQFQPEAALSVDSADKSKRKRYHQLNVNANAIDQELAELRDTRNNLPVLFSPPLAFQANAMLNPTHTPSKHLHSTGYMETIRYDESLSQKWADALKDSMHQAEKVREAEDMRPMAYQLVPEVWTRLRQNPQTEPLESRSRTLCGPTNGEGRQLPLDDIQSIKQPISTSWVAVTCRPPSALDIETSVVVEYLSRTTNSQLSCGAKFGADFLIYDGPREERHAFAGIRILPAASAGTESTNNAGPLDEEISFPLPTTYSLAGYVRTLNTAGKLALLATVVSEVDGDTGKPNRYRLAFVDVALEKILDAPTHKRYKRTEKRRDVAQNLAKTR